MVRHRWTIIAIAYFTGVLLADLLSRSNQTFTGLFALVPVLLALEWGPLVVALGSLPLVVLTATDVFMIDDNPTEAVVIRTVGVGIGLCIGAYSASYRVRHDETLSLSRAAAVAAQNAILPTVPESIGAYRFSCAYRSAADESLIGGDFYKVIDTEFGVRVLLGDVQGKGLGAIAMTAAVLGSFREWAPETTALKHLVARLDARVVDKAGQGDFVTTVVATLDEHLHVEIANCGHPSPLHLTRDGTTTGVIPEHRTTPLGLSPDPAVSQLQLSPGDRLLFYTDGFIEARDADGIWIELDRSLIGGLISDPFDEALDMLLARVAARIGILRDDVALLLVECQPIVDGTR